MAKTKKQGRPSWRGGSPDYMWWLVTILQAISILVNFLAAWLK